MKKGTVVLIAVAALLAAGGSGWLAAEEMEEDHEDLGEILAVFEVLTADLKSPAEAVEAALKEVPGRCLEAELGAVRVKGAPTVAWEMEILTGETLVDVTVDARTGKILATEKEGEAAEVREKLPEGVALGALVESIGKTVSGRVVKVELEEERGVPAYEILLVHGGRMSEMVASARTGKILPGFDDDEEHADDHAENED